MGKYIAQTDLESALSAETVAQLFVDDTAPGVVNTTAIADVIDRAEGEVDSYLFGVVDVSQLVAADRMLKQCALEFAICFSFERHPEYVKTFGESQRGGDTRFKRAQARMERVQAAIQRLPDQAGANTPVNVGGVVQSTTPNMLLGSNGNGF